MSKVVIIDDDGKERSAYGGIYLFGAISFVIGLVSGCIIGSWLTLMF